MSEIEGLKEQIQCIAAHLGIRDRLCNSDTQTVIDDLYSRLNALREVAEFNSMVIHELIQADIIPPTILKKVKLVCDINSARRRLEKLGHQFDTFKRIKASEMTLDGLAQEMVKIQGEIEQNERELKTFQ